MQGKSIAILGTRGIPASYGGFETFAEELAIRLAERGMDVTVYCESRRGGMPPISEYRGVKLRSVRSPSLGPLTTICFDLLCLWYARKDYDFVYMLGYGSSLFCFIPRLWNTQVMLNMDGVEWLRSKWGFLAKMWLKAMESAAMWTPNRLIADAEGIYRHLRSRHARMTHCSVIPYGAPVIEEEPSYDALKTWNLIAGSYYLVVCRLVPENHVWEILQGFTASASRYRLIIMGNHKTDTKYVRRLLTVRDDRVRFIGPIYDKITVQALRYHAWGYFHGHSVGGTNPSLLEAMGCGNTVIAHDNAFNREVAGDAAYYFTGPFDIPDILSRIESLPIEERTHLAMTARDRIREKYDWDLIVDKYLSVFQRQRSR